MNAQKHESVTHTIIEPIKTSLIGPEDLYLEYLGKL